MSILIDILLPNREELLPIINDKNTFYECGFNKDFNSLPFEKQLQVVCDLVRQTIYVSPFPHPEEGINNLIGNCYTAAYVSKKYLEKLNIGKNIKIVFGRARMFEPEDNTTIHLLNLVEDDNGVIYQFDATPFVGDGMGKVQKLSTPLYQEYVEVNKEIEFFVKKFIEIVYEDYYGLLTIYKIQNYLKIINEASTYDVLKGYCTKCLKILSKYLTGYEKENAILLASKFKKYSKLNKEGYLKRIEIINKEIKKWEDELNELKLSNSNIKRQLELASNIIQEKKMFDPSYERFANIGGEQYRLSFINPRVLMELGINSIMIKPSAYFINKEDIIRKKMLFKDRKSFGEYNIDLSKPTEQTGIKPMLFSHPLGEEYIRSMTGNSTILLVNDEADNLNIKKRYLRENLCSDMWNKQIKWIDNEYILWDPCVTNLIHSADNYSESALHYLIGYPEHQAMTRFMYPNKKLVRKKNESLYNNTNL